MRHLLVAGIVLLLPAGLLPASAAADAPGGGGKKVESLITDLKSTDNAVRLAAVTALAAQGPKAEAAVPGLVEVLRANNEDLRLNAAIALGKVGKAAVPAL